MQFAHFQLFPIFSYHRNYIILHYQTNKDAKNMIKTSKIKQLLNNGFLPSIENFNCYLSIYVKITNFSLK